ncbi:EAL domain-containing protein [Salinicola sp. JS01]|uniref:bifunctional diguanylate cyclase/phosphodiesterase n=1 Tax=Salinicola sp. JS01 TaxID=3050071 RepID=UPI00255BB0CF|nr:EAL domain-containing protein [Salinicola sp. JS01]WIX32162.1 EAL domain-containing protein [Salinicola sp. JS01]
MRAHERTFKLDLKWRAMLLTSFLLLGLTILIVWVSNRALVDQFDNARRDFYERQRQEVHFNIQRSADVMRQMASLVAASDHLGKALLNADTERASRALRTLWPTLQLDAGVDEIIVYDRHLDVITSTGRDTPEASARTDRVWLRGVLVREEPADRLVCRQSCQQFEAVPVLAEGTDAGVVVLSRSLADVTRYVQKSSGSEVALLVRQAGDADDARFLPRWNTLLTALTHETELLPFIKTLSRQYTWDAIQGRSLSYSRGGRTYELSTIPIAGTDSDDGALGSFLLVSDVTSQMASISSTTNTILLISLGGWLAAEFILYLILRYRMDQLREISRKLPLLADRQYYVMRQGRQARRSLFVDEIDTLEKTAIDLEVQLEGLEKEVGKRGSELETRVRELARERDFIRGLMNTAEVLVVTHRRDGRMTLVNRFCQVMTGLDEQALKQRSFPETFAVERFDEEEMFAHGSQQESTFVAVDGTTRTIVWYHTPLRTEEAGTEVISVGVDITERKTAENQLSWLANRDPLTELYNRRFFEDSLRRAVVMGHFGAVLYLDLDRFKDVNELSGHHSGDQLLRTVAATLAELNQGSIVARLGGDEFAVLMEHASADLAIERAKQIAEELEHRSLHVDGRIHRASASIGIALYPDNGDSPDELMANADYAMYRAKEDATQRWHLLTPDQQGREDLKNRVFWVEKIRSALLYDQFELMVQPIFRLKDLTIQHYEALLRMRQEDGSYLSPGAFIPVAERTGQIVPIDRWVLSRGIALLASQSDDIINLAVNLSGQSLNDRTLTTFLREEFDKWQVKPHRLVVEVTETAAVTDFTSARGVLEEIRRLGCQVALDDFGVGFSSFYYLGQLPSDYIKIDGSFITTLLDSEESRLIVKAIADIARGLGKKTVAEFVDKPSILPFLANYNIDYAQGFYFGKPMLARDAGFG